MKLHSPLLLALAVMLMLPLQVSAIDSDSCRLQSASYSDNTEMVADTGSTVIYLDTYNINDSNSNGHNRMTLDYDETKYNVTNLIFSTTGTGTISDGKINITDISAGNYPTNAKSFRFTVTPITLFNASEVLTTASYSTNDPTYPCNVSVNPLKIRTTTAPAPAPTPPTITGSNDESGYPVISWPDLTDPEVNGYEVYRDGTSIAQMSRSATNSYTDNNVTLDQTYTYFVKSYRAGEVQQSDPSNSVTLTYTTPTPPPPTTGGTGLTQENIVQLSSLAVTAGLTYIIVRQFRWRT